MPNVLTSGTAQIAKGDKKRLPMDFGDEPELIDGATITGTPTVTCTEANVVITGIQLDYPYQVSALFDATGVGVVAGTYDVSVTITLNDADGTVIKRTGPLRIL